jgi:hypothetical protein
MGMPPLEPAQACHSSINDSMAYNAIFHIDAGGRTNVYLTGPVGEPKSPDAKLKNVCWQKETNLGNLHADGFIWYFDKYLKVGPSAAWPASPCNALINGCEDAPHSQYLKSSWRRMGMHKKSKSS